MNSWGKNQAGLTLIELMVAVAVAIIIASLSTPMMNFVTSNRVTGFVQTFVADLNFARSEAITQGTPVSLCVPAANPNNANPPACAVIAPGNRANWENGWLIFTDVNGDGIINAGTDTLLTTRDALATGYTLGADDVGTITYLASGITTQASNGSWDLCDPSQENLFRRQINIGVTGRVTIIDHARAQASVPQINLTCTVVAEAP